MWPDPASGNPVVESIRQSARESGAAELSLDEIDAEIAASRAARRP